MSTYGWFLADKIGEYGIMWTQYCGLGHSEMKAKLRIVPKDDYQKWLQKE
jgi:cytochrome c oxidase subunit II